MVYSPWGCKESDTTEQLNMWAHIPFRVGFVAHFNHKVSEVKVAQSCPSLWDSMDYTVHGILQDRILDWLAFPFSRGSSQPRD